MRNIYDVDFMFVPFGVSRRRVYYGSALIGYAEYRIFGIRLAMVQETRPY